MVVEPKVLRVEWVIDGVRYAATEELINGWGARVQTPLTAFNKIARKIKAQIAGECVEGVFVVEPVATDAECDAVDPSDSTPAPINTHSAAPSHNTVHQEDTVTKSKVIPAPTFVMTESDSADLSQLRRMGVGDDDAAAEYAMSDAASRWWKREQYYLRVASRAVMLLTQKDPVGVEECEKIARGCHALCHRASYHTGPSRTLVEGLAHAADAIKNIRALSDVTGDTAWMHASAMWIKPALDDAGVKTEEAMQAGVESTVAARAASLLRTDEVREWRKKLAECEQRIMIKNLGSTASPIECEVVDGVVANSTREEWNRMDDVNQRHALDPYRTDRDNRHNANR